eukprot:CAMPEP_0194213248 /NCGR_PEP_ID=MMETSP0156-20130528/13657_1 /TAXON_ID=33649 /ORGANISM="Thalassionema nitzschioides, Strain L26-B" /LENGTH=192 /DNA_ID=CAMNT_0038941237 /DNA_START=23 /DNA_END=601 /DNA_ORIENTATION=+
MMSMSSLQRAAFQKNNKGGFENSFADGLNLCEFSATVDSSCGTQASSAELLREKRKQAAQNIQNDKEDARLDLLAKQRAQKLKESLLESKKEGVAPLSESPLRAAAPWENTGNDLIPNITAASRDKSAIGTFLTAMHENDPYGAQKEGSRHRLNNKKGKGLEKRISGKKTATKSNKKDGKVTKKSKRTKYRR